ncbi:MAG: hypothetical protein JJE22_17335 [Bacteroidia bacterium]|nr:hypothetical protein [Bacteroidia bacterium]
MINRRHIISYLKAGSLLHLVTLLEIFLIINLFRHLQIDKWLAGENFFIKLLTLLPLVIFPLLAQLDARSRYQNYKQLKDHLFLNGFQPRILNLFSKTRCQRCAALVATEELGMDKNCKIYFENLGYRWYHFFPDFIFTQPRYLFSKMFWLNTFFAKTYKSKIDFKNIKKHPATSLVKPLLPHRINVEHNGAIEPGLKKEKKGE